jgi:hypothetical protein
MHLAIDRYDPSTAYADLRETDAMSDALRTRALQRAAELGAEYVEFWRPPYGREADPMTGFIELLAVPRPNQTEGDSDASL